jgi:Sec-independent protein secretion pathway component TatC
VSTFVAGWRPFVGWVCGIAIAYNYVVMPFIVWIAIWIDSGAPAMPMLDTGELMTLLLGMLGLGAMRSYEKTKQGGK